MAPIITGNIDEVEENFTRRGSAARPGQQRTSVMPGRSTSFLDQLLQTVGLSNLGAGGSSPGITGDYSPESAGTQRVTSDAGRGAAGQAPVTAGGAGRGSGTGRTTVGRGGIAVPPQLQATLRSGALFPRAALFSGALLPGLGAAKEQLDEGRPTGAAGALLASAGAAYGAQKLAQATLGGLAKAPGPLGLVGKVGMIAAPIFAGSVASSFGGDIAEYGKRALTGKPIKGATDLQNQIAAQRQVQDFIREVGADNMNTYVAGMTQLSKAMGDIEVEQMKKWTPIIDSQLNKQLVRQQALMNTQGNIYAQLGTVATAGKLATGAQAERGATVRQALASNPYANAVLSAPSISFG